MRCVRTSFVTLLLATVVWSVAPPAHGAQFTHRPSGGNAVDRAFASRADSLPDSTWILSPWRLEPASPCVRDSVFMIVRGFVATACDSFLGAEAIDSLRVRIRLQVRGDLACFAAPSVFYPVPVALGRFSAGPHSGIVEVETADVRADGSRTVTVQQYPFDFVVAPDCPTPPPWPGPLPYVDRITVGPVGICGPERICPQDSVLVQVSGMFPSNCFSFRRIELIPSPAEIFPPLPPTVRIIVDDGGCLGMVCSPGPVAWSASVTLGPMVARDYHLGVELAQVSCSDTYPPGQLYRTSVPFTVAAICPDPVACLIPDFAPGPGVCNATVATGRPAELTFLIRPTVALAGLQGEFRLYPAALRVTRIEPIGAAEGMLLDWTPTTEGARFVLFASSGAPIPPWPSNSRMMEPSGWAVLRVTVAHVSRGGPPPERTVVTTENLLGSDIDGGAVALCPPPPCVDFRLSWGRALICGEGACDFNADGLQDVRDLVLMVRCVNGEGSCPADTGGRFDCDGDGTFALADVLCCARNVLLRPPCPECPPDTAQARPEPGVAVSFGTPEETASGIALPVRITGEDRLGGAMLTLEAPLDRYDVAGFDVSPAGNWLTLHEVRDGRLVLGLIGMRSGNELALYDAARFTLRLALRPGQPAGGQVTAVAGEFSGPDGVTLIVSLGRPTQSLPGAGRLELSESRPNPFSDQARFTLQMVEAADVTVGIYDLRGRSVATLFQGPLPSGPKEFQWDGRGTDGSVVPNGVYFYRASLAGKAIARKLILMRGD